MRGGSIGRGVLAAGAAALLAGIAAVPAFATGQVLPIAVAADAVDTDPRIDTRDYKGHKAWSILWPRDEAGRALHLGFVETLRLPYRDHPQEMLDFARDQSSTDPAELTLDHGGRAEIIWGRDVFWLVMSERAVMKPDPQKPETMLDGRLHRGETRRHCAVFTTDPTPRQGTLVGAYCRDLAPGSALDEATARQWLENLDLTVAGEKGDMIRSE